MTADGYVYLEMVHAGEDRFSAQLPPANIDVKGLDYLLLFGNDRGEFSKTKPFRMLILKGRPGKSPTKDPVKVYWENGKTPTFGKAFAVPLEILPSPTPRLAEAKEHDYPTIVSESSPLPALPPFSGPGGFSFSIKIGGVGVFYGGR